MLSNTHNRNTIERTPGELHNTSLSLSFSSKTPQTTAVIDSAPSISDYKFRKMTPEYEHMMAPGPEGNSIELISARPAQSCHQELLLVHGAKHGAWCWQENFMDYFVNEGFAVHALSLRGHGNSTGRTTVEKASFSDYVADVIFAKRFLSLHRPVIIGHSLGGALAQKALEQEDFSAGVLLAAMPPGGSLGVLLQMSRRHPLRSLKALMSWSLGPIYEKPDYVKEAFFSPDISDSELSRYWDKLSPESFGCIMRTLDPFLHRSNLVKAPLLVIGAENDTLIPPKLVHKTAAFYGKQALMLPGTSHDLMLDPNWRLCADSIIEFINSQRI